jgi:hypothetical protein
MTEKQLPRRYIDKAIKICGNAYMHLIEVFPRLATIVCMALVADST